MKIIAITAVPVLIAIAASIQWKDCVRGYGNTMGVYGLINGIWMISGVCLAVGVSGSVGWLWAIFSGAILFTLYYPASALIEKLGFKYGPRKK